MKFNQIYELNTLKVSYMILCTCSYDVMDSIRDFYSLCEGSNPSRNTNRKME